MNKRTLAVAYANEIRFVANTHPYTLGKNNSSRRRLNPIDEFATIISTPEPANIPNYQKNKKARFNPPMDIATDSTPNMEQAAAPNSTEQTQNIKATDIATDSTSNMEQRVTSNTTEHTQTTEHTANITINTTSTSDEHSHTTTSKPPLPRSDRIKQKSMANASNIIEQEPTPKPNPITGSTKIATARRSSRLRTQSKLPLRRSERIKQLRMANASNNIEQVPTPQPHPTTGSTNNAPTRRSSRARKSPLRFADEYLRYYSK
jgi:hypothetical protein